LQDAGSNVLEQLGEQRARVAERLAQVRHVLAVGSGKGGVGKSTLTSLLAGAFRNEGRRVSILDADLNGPSQARLAGLGATPLVPTAQGLVPPDDRRGVGVVSLGSLIAEGEPLEFDSVARGDSHVWRATREFTLLAQLLGAVHWGERDVLLVDLPPGSERTLQYAEFLGPRAAFVLVTLPSSLSRSVVMRSIAALSRAPGRLLGYVENMKGYYCGDCGRVQPLFPEHGRLELQLPCLGSLPFDPALAGAIEGSPGADRPSVRAVRATARRILEALEGEEESHS
jgi:ATP-binding protein involved in chromosome partitioning